MKKILKRLLTVLLRFRRSEDEKDVLLIPIIKIKL
jgi:hypothetical protein